MSDLSRYRKKRDPAKTTEPFSAERELSQVDSTGAPVADAESARGTDSPDGARRETWAGRFVIHEHAARRKHYDVRLPIGGVLRSFAVPHGPSLDPKQKHLAVETEDHPLEYLDFEDVIPEGNYGAGAMIVWDTGGVRYVETSAEEGVARGKIDFILTGSKVTGRFALIATGRRKAASGLAGTKQAVAEWLLIKKPDAAAVEGDDVTLRLPRSVLSGMTVEELANRDALAHALLALARERGAEMSTKNSAARASAFQAPMVCEPSSEVTADPNFLYELKLDGVRICAEKTVDGVKLRYRSGRVATTSYQDVARAVRSLPLDRVTLDGEIVTFDASGKPNFFGLMPRIQSKRPADVERVRLEVPVVYLVFDLLEIGHGPETLDLRRLPLTARKELLFGLIRGKGLLQALDHIEGDGRALFAFAEAKDLEGIVAKRSSAPYVHGPRVTGHWLKIKRAEDHDYVVVGYTKGKGLRGALGALAIASYEGKRLIYRGRVGSGLDDRAATELIGLLSERIVPEPSADGIAPAEVETMTHVRPEIVVRIRAQGTTDGGHLRAPVFLGVRADVEPDACRTEVRSKTDDGDEPAVLLDEDAPDAESSPFTGDQTTPTTLGSVTRSRLSFVTNRTKVYFPEDGYTKGDLVDYYTEIAPVMLPFLRGRPVVLVRYPDGITGKNFYQWRAPEGLPPSMRTLELWDEEKQSARGGTKSAFLVDDAVGLAFVANLGCIPLHVLAGRETSPAECDFVTIDFDLGPRPLRDAVVLALDLRKLLEELGLAGYPKTSGQRGLHVLIPLGPGVPFESAKLLGELLGRVLVGRHPQIATMERRKDRRGDRLYVDTGQTGRSRTIVAPYSVRAHPGATVSTPLYWEEVHLALDPSSFTIRSVPGRVASRGNPLARMLDETPDLGFTLARLSAWTGRDGP